MLTQPIIIVLDKFSEMDVEEPIPDCVNRNFEITGLDVVEPSSLPSLGLAKCQKLCKHTLGCLYFSWRHDYVPQCFLKLGDAAEPWNDASVLPRLASYSGPAKCGTKYLLSVYTLNILRL